MGHRTCPPCRGLVSRWSHVRKPFSMVQAPSDSVPSCPARAPDTRTHTGQQAAAIIHEHPRGKPGHENVHQHKNGDRPHSNEAAHGSDKGPTETSTTDGAVPATRGHSCRHGRMWRTTSTQCISSFTWAGVGTTGQQSADTSIPRSSTLLHAASVKRQWQDAP